MRRFVLACLILFGTSSAAQATVWHIAKSEDPFTETENVAALATGDHGGALLVRCYESKFELFLRVPPEVLAKEKARNDAMQKQLEQQAPELAAQLAGQPHEATTNYRFRIDRSATYTPPLLFSPAPITQYHGGNYVDASGPSGTYVEDIIEKIRSGKWLIYQVPPKTGPVYKISLTGAYKHLLPVVRECKQQQEAAMASRKKAEQARRRQLAAEEKKRQQEQTRRDRQLVAPAINQIAHKVQQNFIYPPGLPTGLSCTIDVRMVAGGDVSDVSIVKSSGNATFDRQVETAVRKAAPLPVPEDPRLFDKLREIQFSFAPKQ